MIVENGNGIVGKITVAACAALIAGLLMWMASTMWNINTIQTRVVTRLDILTEAIREQMADRYFGADARRDFSLRDERINNLDKRISALENARKPK